VDQPPGRCEKRLQLTAHLSRPQQLINAIVGGVVQGAVPCRQGVNKVNDANVADSLVIRCRLPVAVGGQPDGNRRFNG